MSEPKVYRRFCINPIEGLVHIDCTWEELPEDKKEQCRRNGTAPSKDKKEEVDLSGPTM